MQLDEVKDYLIQLQKNIIDSLTVVDGKSFNQDVWKRPLGGGGITSIVENGPVIERGGVNFSHVFGETLPPSATLDRPELTGCAFEAMGLSVVIHPQNPFVPTIHMNIRFFIAKQKKNIQGWWFGGGIDLTPYYGNESDVKQFHLTLKKALDPFGKEYYQRFKKWCDAYFYIRHRNEHRGVGGVFFDDLSLPNFETCFAISQNIGNCFIPAYIPIVENRRDTEFGKRERMFQLYRRARYVEFNLVYDRGTLFGLQSQGRIESILMSMPPLASWQYDWTPEPGSAEEELVTKFLIGRDWIN